jgi:hypothetical protein
MKPIEEMPDKETVKSNNDSSIGKYYFEIIKIY